MNQSRVVFLSQEEEQLVMKNIKIYVAAKINAIAATRTREKYQLKVADGVKPI